MQLNGSADRGFGRHWTLQAAPPGARLHTHPGGPGKSLVELLRLAGIPPWRRPALPVLVIDGVSRALGPDWLDHEFRAWLERNNAELIWHQRPATLLPCAYTREAPGP